MGKTLGYIIFISYDRRSYEKVGITFDDMSLKKFIYFYTTENEIGGIPNCMSVSVKPINDDTTMFSNKSEKFDDSIMWYVSKEGAEPEYISEFISKFLLEK